MTWTSEMTAQRTMRMRCRCEKMMEKLFLDKCPLPPLVGTSPHLVRSKPQHILMGQIRYNNARRRSVARENRHRASGFGGKGPQLPMPEILACHP